MSQATEQIAKQFADGYADYNKLKTLVDVGFFLENYVVEGGEATKDATYNNKINVTEIVTSLDNDVTRREATSFTTKISSTTYYLDYQAGDFKWGTSNPSGSYLPIAQVTTDSNQNVSVITDMRGAVGGFRLLSEYGLTGFLRGRSVADYGAKGDAHYFNNGQYYQDKEFTIPANDDTAAFNLATQAAIIHTGGNGTLLKQNIIVPPGDYLISGTVYVHKGQHLKGAGIGASRIVIPVTAGTSPTFILGQNSAGVADSGGLPPAISDLSTEGGSTAAPLIDCNGVAGVSLYNLFITSAGIGIKAAAGDLQIYNVTFDISAIGLVIDGSSRNVVTACSFYNNNFGVQVTGSAYDTIISDCNFAYSKFADIGIQKPAAGFIKNLSIVDCNFVGNGQYTTYFGAIFFDGVLNSEVKINGCEFRNLYSYGVNSLNGASANTIDIEDCAFNGDKTHDQYIQGTTSKGVYVGNNYVTVTDCKFKNLRGPYCIHVDGTSGTLLVDSCKWLNNTAATYFIQMTAAGTSVTAANNIGDNVLPLINCIAAATVDLKRNVNWLGSVQTASGKKFIVAPTFYGNFNGIVKFSGNPNNAGSALYRKTGLFSVYRYTDFSGSILDYVAKTNLSQAPAGTNPVIDITVTLDTVTGPTSGATLPNRYIVIAVPDTWSDIDFDVS